MQVFIIGSPFETAKALDKLRLNKQIIECKQILRALNGDKAWSNHPCTLQYKDHQVWLVHYLQTLVYYSEYLKATDIGSQDRFLLKARLFNRWSFDCTPPFHTKEYYDQMKRRLYTKDPKFYSDWSYLGTSEINWYFVDGQWKYYQNGKQIKALIL